MQRKYILMPVIIVTMIAGLFAVAYVLSAADNKSDKSIKWRTDYKKAVEDAKKYAKPVMIDFYTDWCGWCKKLDKDTYTDSRVVQLSRKFVNIKVDGDKSPDIVKPYKIEGYPTIVFLNAKGKESRRIVGYKDADEFLKIMKQVVEKAN